MVVCLGACASRPPEQPVVTIAGAPEETAVSSAAPPPESTDKPRPRLLQWETDEAAARARARREHLPMLVFLGAAWSGGSLQMQREVLSDPRLLFQPSPIVALSIDCTNEDDPNVELLAARYDVKGVPTTIVFDAEGHEVARFDVAVPLDDVLGAIRKAWALR